MLRELDQRTSHGLTITLQWNSETDRVLVRCDDEDAPGPPLLSYPVEPHDARYAFLHPFSATMLDAGNAAEQGSDRPQVVGYDADEAEVSNDRPYRWYRLRLKPRGRDGV
jgi:hypothetical protein